MCKASKVFALLLASEQTGYEKGLSLVLLKIQKGGCFFGLFKNHNSLNTRRISGK